jgi:hypothetical protein
MRWRGKERTTFGHRMKWTELVLVVDPWFDLSVA